jgi:signal recognition particle subunit SRP54
MEAIDVFSCSYGRTYPWNGDVVSLVERAQEQFDEEEARKFKRKSPKNLVLMISFSNSTSEENG